MATVQSLVSEDCAGEPTLGDWRIARNEERCQFNAFPSNQRLETDIVNAAAQPNRYLKYT